MKFLLLLLLPIAANAQILPEHFPHTTDKMNSSENYLRQALEKGDIVFSCDKFTDFQQSRARNFHTYMDRAFEDMAEARELLSWPGSDPHTIRRLLSQPHKKAHKDGGEPSALQWVAQQTRNLRFFVGACPENDEALNIMIQKMTLGWQFLDLAVWHINDAIHQEND